MFGSLKRLRNSLKMTDLSSRQESQESDKGKDNRAVIIIAAMLAVTVILTLVKATYDPITQAELKSLKISAFDVILFLTAVVGYFVIKKRGKK